MGKQAFCVLALLLVPGLASAASFTLDGYGPSRASGVSADGSVVVGSLQQGGRRHAFRWIGPALFVLPDETESRAGAVSTDGAVVVGASFDNLEGSFSEAVRWTGGVMTGLGAVEGRGVSAVTGNWRTYLPTRGCRADRSAGDWRRSATSRVAG